jgi:hypothetical protein
MHFFQLFVFRTISNRISAIYDLLLIIILVFGQSYCFLLFQKLLFHLLLKFIVLHWIRHCIEIEIFSSLIYSERIEWSQLILDSSPQIFQCIQPWQSNSHINFGTEVKTNLQLLMLIRKKTNKIILSVFSIQYTIGWKTTKKMDNWLQVPKS